MLLLNPGGPGGSGTWLPSLKDAVPDGGGDAYDWIGFDPRGVGESKPALQCEPDYFSGPRPPYDPTTKAIEQTWITRSQQYATACDANNGSLLAQITTENTAKDMDAIRVALGQQQINYFGFSYGTYLGAVYATLFPSHLRRTILDSSVDPRAIWYRANVQQDDAFQTVLGMFFAWVAQYDDHYHLGTTQAAVAARYAAVERELAARPSGDVGAAEWVDTVVDAGYTQADWPDVASVFSAWAVRHDATALEKGWRRFGDTTDDNQFAVYNAVECNESRWPTASAYLKDAAALDRTDPYLAWYNTWFNGPCMTWPVKPVAPVEVDGTRAGGVLLIDETLDAATPFEGSLEMRKRFPKSVLLAEPGGTSHAFSLRGDDCVDETIAAYLRTGRLPARKVGAGPDLTCDPLPAPVPADASSS